MKNKDVSKIGAVLILSSIIGLSTMGAIGLGAAFFITIGYAFTKYKRN